MKEMTPESPCLKLVASLGGNIFINTSHIINILILSRFLGVAEWMMMKWHFLGVILPRHKINISILYTTSTSVSNEFEYANL